MAKPRLRKSKQQWRDGYNKKVRIDLSKDINLMSQIIVDEIKSGIDEGKDINGKNFKKLKTATIKQKIKKGYPLTPLKATGKMQKVYVRKRATKDKQRAVVSMPLIKRGDIGFYHNEGKGNLPLRKWFGIGKVARRRLDKYIKLRIRNLLRL